MTTLVKRGTARRLGLRLPNPLPPWIDGHLSSIDDVSLSLGLPRIDGIAYTGERRWP